MMRWLIPLLTSLLMFGAQAMATPQPPYTTELRDGAFEVRVYPPMIVAEVTAQGVRERAANRGFEVLANFIFGANRTRAKIAMTAPVIQAPQSETIAMTAPVIQAPEADGAWRIQFIMPGSYALDTLPQPVDQSITIAETPVPTLAVVRFSGTTPAATLAQKTDALRAWMADRGLVATGPAQYAFYDPPWTLPVFKRNEVMIPVR